MNRVTHFEIPATDKTKSKEFYANVFGWQIMDVPVQMDGGTGSYLVATTVATDPTTQQPTEPGAINGALRERTSEITAPVIVISVGSVDEHLKKITAAGGSVVEGKTEVPDMGYYAYVTDPAGNVIGIWQDAGS